MKIAQKHKRILDGSMPSELKRKIKELARKSRREDEDTALLCLSLGAEHIPDEPWFMAGVPVKD